MMNRNPYRPTGSSALLPKRDLHDDGPGSNQENNAHPFAIRLVGRSAQDFVNQSSV